VSTIGSFPLHILFYIVVILTCSLCNKNDDDDVCHSEEGTYIRADGLTAITTVHLRLFCRPMLGSSVSLPSNGHGPLLLVICILCV